MATGFFTDERCFWHGGGNYVLTAPVGGLVQPGGGLPENPETKRRLRNLIEVTGLARELGIQTASEATREDLLRVHPAAYLDAFKAASDAGGGELGLRTPFGPGGYEIAALSAGLTKAAVFDVLAGQLLNAYALSRPPGHHALPDWPNGFCLLNNIAIAIRAAQAAGLARRVAVVVLDRPRGSDDLASSGMELPARLGCRLGAGRGEGAWVQYQHPPAARHRSCELSGDGGADRAARAASVCSGSDRGRLWLRRLRL